MQPVCVRSDESHRQIRTGTYFFAFISWHLRAIFRLVASTFSHNNSCYIHDETLMD